MSLSVALTSLALALAGGVLAGCGSSGSGGSTNTSGSPSSPIALAQCMHAHGVPSFPDPTSGAGGPGFAVSATPGSSTVSINGINFSGPAFQAAIRVCGLFKRVGSAPQPTEAMRERLLAFARCMRSHGVPDFPDPQFAARAAGLQVRLPADHNAPAFQQAVRTCREH